MSLNPMFFLYSDITFTGIEKYFKISKHFRFQVLSDYYILHIKSSKSRLSFLFKLICVYFDKSNL